MRRRLAGASAPDEGPERTGDAPRPPGTFARRIAHSEQVQYSYDPTTGEFSARVVERTDPVVTGWDGDPPSRRNRPVGTWDVMPNPDGVTVEQSVDAQAVPAHIRDTLRVQAERRGEPVTATRTIEYDHDLDSGQTEARLQRGGRPARTTEQPRGLNDRYVKALERMAEAARKQPPPAARRRSSKGRDKDLLKGPYKLPEVVITTEASTRRGSRM